MKNNFAHPPKRKYLGRSGFWLLLFFAINLTFFSCVTEESPSTDMVNEVETDQAVEDARAWFGPQEEFEIPPKNGINSKGKTQTKKVFWDDYMIHKGGAVIELKVSYNFHTVPITGEKTALELAEKAEKVFHRLIIEKDEKGEYVKYLLKYFPKNDTDANQATLETNNFQGLDAGYSGEVQLLTWEEELLKGWTIAEGEITRAYFPRRTSQKPVSDVQAALNCQPSYIEICEVNPVGSGSGVRINVDLPEVVVEPHCYDIISYDPNCSPDTGSGGPGTYTNPTGPGGGGGGSSPGTGGSTPVLDDEQLWQQYIDGIIDPELKRQAQLDYLENHGGAEFVELINELMASVVDHWDVLEINKLVNRVYMEQRGKFMMAIFSPENLSQILFLAMSDISVTLRNKVFTLSAQYSAYSEIALMLGSKSWTVAGVKITFSGYTNHGTLAYGMSKGFTSSLIKNILNNGTVTKVAYGNGYQLRILYPYNGKTIGIVVDANPGTYNFGKIVTYLTDY